MAIRLAIHIIDADRQGPTLNVSYNNLLRRWGGATPECEDCGDDLSGKQVHETRTNWVCTSCKVEANDYPLEVDEAYHERQQMGLVNF